MKIFEGLLSTHRFVIVFQTNPIINYLQFCSIGKVHFERKKPWCPKQKNNLNLKGLRLFCGFEYAIWNDTAAETAHEHVNVPPHSRFTYNVSFSGSVHYHSYAHCYIPLAVITNYIWTLIVPKQRFFYPLC